MSLQISELDSRHLSSNSGAVLIGNSFPLSLIRRPVVIRPVSRNDVLAASAGHTVISFWGHNNTLAAAVNFLGIDLTPPCARPVLRLDSEAFPCYVDMVFHDCWVLSPDYQENFRPEVDQEVPTEKIIGWQLLHLQW